MHGKDFGQSGRMPNLIRVFTGRKCDFVGFVLCLLLCFCGEIRKKYLSGCFFYLNYNCTFRCSIVQSVQVCLQIQGCAFESDIAHITSMEIDHKIITIVNEHLGLIQEGLLLVTGKSICTKY